MTKAWLLMAALAAGLVGLSAVPAQAATLNVCPSGCKYTQIPQALAAAASGDMISVAPGTYRGGFTISKNVTVVGSGAGQTTVKGTGRVGVDITVASGVTTTIEALTVDAAAAGTGLAGDAVYNFGSLTVQDAAVTGSDNNGALFNQGPLTMDHGTVSGNSATGIVIGGGPVAINRSTISGNGGPFAGGIDIGNSVTVSIAHSTISGNGGERTGGVNNNNGTLTIRASTISGNNGGGIANGVSGTIGPASTLTLYRVTVKDNFGGSPAGIWNGIDGVAALHHSRVMHNTGLDVAGSIGGIWNQGTLTLDHSNVRHNIPNDCVGC